MLRDNKISENRIEDGNKYNGAKAKKRDWLKECVGGRGGGWVESLNSLIRVDLPEQVTFRGGSEGNEGLGPAFRGNSRQREQYMQRWCGKLLKVFKKSDRKWFIF